MKNRSSYFVVCQHSGGTNYYVGSVAVDSNNNIKILNMTTSNAFVVSPIPESNNIKISTDLQYWSCDIIEISN